MRMDVLFAWPLGLTRYARFNCFYALLLFQRLYAGFICFMLISAAYAGFHCIRREAIAFMAPLRVFHSICIGVAYGPYADFIRLVCGILYQEAIEPGIRYCTQHGSALLARLTLSH